jgi:iron complex transport system ATP-binding protein
MRLDIKDLEYSYSVKSSHYLRVLEKISFTISDHELICILGPNGAGKSTLLKCMNKVLIPDKGSVTLDGTDIKDMGRKEIARKIGYVPQINEVSGLTVFDTVLLGRYPHIKWHVSSRDLGAVNSILQKLNLTHLAMRLTSELSGGEVQKVSTARALVQEPELLLFDEPTSSLDLKNQVNTLELIRRVVTEHKVSAVLTMHDLNIALRYCDRFIFLKSGRIFADCRKKDVTPAIVEEVYNIPVSLEFIKNIPVIIPAV